MIYKTRPDLQYERHMIYKTRPDLHEESHMIYKTYLTYKRRGI